MIATREKVAGVGARFEASTEMDAVHAHPPATHADRLGATLTFGFGVTVAMWAVGYLLHLPGLAPPGWLVLGGLIVCLLSGGHLAGRLRLGGVPAAAGMLTGLLNLLILGSQLVDADSGGLRAGAWLWIPASIVACAAAMQLGALTAPQRGRKDTSTCGDWNARLAVVALAATAILLSIGGVVTGFQAGLAVPDWPNSYGFNMFLYPLARMTGGIYYEHSHRLFGALVGLTTLVLTVRVWRTESTRRGVRTLAVAALVLVALQGALGGLRVTGRPTLSADPADLEPSIGLAITHGVLAQFFFSTVAVLAAVLTRTWRFGCRQRSAGSSMDRAFGILAITAIFTQLILGALYRHLIVAAVLYMHIGMAVVVLVVAGGFALRVWGAYEDRPVLPTLGGTLLIGIGVQLLFGFGALAVTLLEAENAIPMPLQVLITTVHQTIGALLLAGATCLLLWHLRLVTAAAPMAAPAERIPRTELEPVGAGAGTAAGRTVD